MQLHKLGDRSKALCPFCKQVRTTTFEERDVPLSSGKGLVRDVLAAVCDSCGRVVAIPQQSVPRIKETVRFSRHSLETRIPRHLLDAVALACHELGYGTDCGVVLFRYYLQRVASEPRLRARLALLSASSDAQGRASARFSAKLNDELHEALLDLERTTRLKKADVVKGLIVQMKQDILDARRRDVRRDVQRVLRLAG